MIRLACALVLCLAVAGCSREGHDSELPGPCRSGAERFAAVLERAPAEVRLDGTPISACLAKDSPAGDVQLVGEQLLGAARLLARERDAAGLGYLVGALERGSARTQGIHAEVVRRVQLEAGALSGSAEFERGRRAGRTSG